MNKQFILTASMVTAIAIATCTIQYKSNSEQEKILSQVKFNNSNIMENFRLKANVSKQSDVDITKDVREINTSDTHIADDFNNMMCNVIGAWADKDSTYIMFAVSGYHDSNTFNKTHMQFYENGEKLKTPVSDSIIKASTKYNNVNIHIEKLSGLYGINSIGYDLVLDDNNIKHFDSLNIACDTYTEHYQIIGTQFGNVVAVKNDSVNGASRVELVYDGETHIDDKYIINYSYTLYGDANAIAEVKEALSSGDIRRISDGVSLHDISGESNTQIKTTDIDSTSASVSVNVEILKSAIDTFNNCSSIHEVRNKFKEEFILQSSGTVLYF